METKIGAVAKFYDKVKPIYNLALELFFQKGRHLISKSILQQNLHATHDLHKVYEAHEILEIGCNIGQMAHLLDKKARYSGIDVSSKCISAAKADFINQSNIQFAIMDGENNHFPNESFDLIILAYVLSVTPNAKKLMNECHRLLKKDGTVLIVNHFSGSLLFKKLDAWVNKLFFSGVKFYFPISSITNFKGFNFVEKQQVNLFWTYLELKKI